LPDISDAKTFDPTDVAGGGIAVVVALEVSSVVDATSVFLGDCPGSF
jgi:hypothetical protein